MFTLVVPVYNDGPSLSVLLEEFEVLKSKEVKLILIDNGSSDIGVWLQMTEVQKNVPGVRAVRSEKNLGFGGAVALGVNLGYTRYVGWMPANLKVRVSDAIDVYKATIQSNSVCGKGFRVRSDIAGRVKSRLASSLLSLLFRENMTDFGGTPTVILKDALDSFVVGAPLGVDFDAFVSAKLSNFKIKTIRPRVNYGSRLFWKSSWQNGFLSEMRLLAQIAKQRKSWTR